MKGKPLGLIIDETTDLSVKSQLAVVIQYFSEDSYRQEYEVVDVVECNDKTAVGLTKLVLDLLRKNDIDPQMIVGFCADTTNSMFGCNNSVSTHLKKEIPKILCVKCSCHSIHLCSHYASLHIPKRVEDVVRGVCNHFSRSPLRRANFQEFQKLMDVEDHVFVSPGQTRWLTMEYAVSRVLEQYEALVKYYEQLCKEDPTVSHDVILTSLEDEMTKIYLEFLKYALNLFNEFNTLFQSERPLLHILKKTVEDLITSLANNFMENDYVNSVAPLMIDPFSEENYLPDYEVYLGKLTLSL